MSPQSPTGQKSDQPRPTILVVDDEAEMRTAVRQHLTRAGYNVREALNGKGALKEISDGRISVVVTDVYMPDMDGMEFITWMSRQTSGIPVIAMTGAMSGGRRLDPATVLGITTRLGAVRTLAKPFEATALLDAVEAALKPTGSR